MRSAMVLGARKGSGNIGDAVVKELISRGWDTRADDCWDADRSKYSVPVIAAMDSDALVVSLGATAKLHIGDMTRSGIQDVIDGCLTLPLQAVAEYVRWRGALGGRIILIGSYAHRHPFTNGTAYCAAKAGIEMAGKTLAWELTGDGYVVNVVHPYHVVGTPMWETVQEGVMESRTWSRSQADAYAEKDLRLESLSTPQDVAEVVAGMLEASPHLSGSSVEIFGGVR